VTEIKKSILLIYNPMAGKGVKLKWIQELCRAFEEKNFEVLPHPTSEVEGAFDICNEFYDRTDIFMVIGGDGTINSALQRLVNQEKPLVVVPRGTANIFGNVLNLKLRKIEEIVKCVEGFNVETFPVGKVKYESKSIYFLLMAGVGFDAEVVKRTKKRKGIFNKFFFFKSSLKTLRDYDFPQFKVDFNGGGILSKFCIISNVSMYAGKFRICKDFELKDRKLCVCSFDWEKKSRGIVYFYYLLRGKLDRLEDVKIFELERCRIYPIDHKSTVLFQIDGENGGKLPIEVSMESDTIKVLLP